MSVNIHCLRLMTPEPIDLSSSTGSESDGGGGGEHSSPANVLHSLVA